MLTFRRCSRAPPSPCDSKDNPDFRPSTLIPLVRVRNKIQPGLMHPRVGALLEFVVCAYLGTMLADQTIEDKIAATARLRWQQVLADDDTSGGFWVEKIPFYLKCWKCFCLFVNVHAL